MKLKCLSFLFFSGSFFFLAQAQQAQINVVQDERIPAMLELKNQMTKNNELGDRYKVQIMGYGQNLNQANKVLNEYKSKITDWEGTIVYENNYKVWIGSFRNRLEADRALLRIKKVFPDAFVLKPKG